MKNLLLSSFMFLFLTSCATKTTAPALEIENQSINNELSGDSDSGLAGRLQTVTFTYKSSSISGDAKKMMDENTVFLIAHPKIEILIEGHTDERGGTQYNLSLGEKRSMSVRDYLISRSIESSRIKIVSLGKEKPIALGHDESSWGKNRRANFVITQKE